MVASRMAPAVFVLAVLAGAQIALAFNPNLDDTLWTGPPQHNTMQSVDFSPARFVQPTSEAEVQQIVRETAARNGHVRVVGSGCSWTPVAASLDTMMSVDRLDAVKRIWKEGSRYFVTVGAGIRIYKLLNILDNPALSGFPERLTMQMMGWSKRFALSGVMQAGTHGSHRGLPIMAEYVQAYRLVLANGEAIRCSAKENSKYFQNKVAMGLLGIVTEITLEVLPAYNMRLQNSYFDLPTMFQRMVSPAVSNLFIEWWWCNTCEPDSAVQEISRAITTDPITPVLTHEQTGSDCNHLGGCTMESDGSGSCYNGPTLDGGCVDKNYLAMTDEEELKYWESESYVPGELAKDAVNAWINWTVQNEASVQAAIDALPNGTLKEEQQANLDRRRTNGWSGVRFVRGDGNWLSAAYDGPSSNRPVTAVLSTGMYYGLDASGMAADWPWVEAYLRQFHLLMKKFGGRPHWGKLHWATREELQALYPRLDDFEQLRAGADPRGLFDNFWTAGLVRGTSQPRNGPNALEVEASATGSGAATGVATIAIVVVAVAALVIVPAVALHRKRRVAVTQEQKAIVALDRSSSASSVVVPTNCAEGAEAPGVTSSPA